jgi:hypothetical protein
MTNKPDKSTFVREHYEKEVDQAKATEDFLTQMQTTLDELRTGKRTLKFALAAICTSVENSDLDDVTMDPETRAKLKEHQAAAGNEEIMAVGPPHDMMEMVSRLPEMLSADLVAEHEAECESGDQCVMSDPEVAPLIGTLKAMALVFARASAKGNVDAVQFLRKSLREMGSTALRLCRENKINDLQGFAIDGEKAEAFMKALLDAGVLPPELAEQIKAKLDKAEDDTTSPPENMDAKCTFVKNGASTKH